ncbi:MAG: zf-HC2 domain-containing protein, partial [Planctomycetes bacterium]|nr:zf-HC2 domain-containing protein [Planctomycetota bacterium]
MNCRRARSALQRAADGELPLGERLEVEAHARDCERCAPLARRLTELDDAFTRFPEPPVESLDLDAQVRAVRARVEREHDAPVRVPVRRRALVLAAAAVLVAALAGLALLLRGSRPAAGPIVEDGGPAPRSIEEVVPAPIDTTDGERTVGTGATPGGLTHEVGDAPIVPQPARDAVTTLAPTPEVAPEPIDAPAPT